MVGGIFAQEGSVGAMRQLSQQSERSSPAALEGLLKTVVDYMYGKIHFECRAATSGNNLMKPDAQTFRAPRAAESLPKKFSYQSQYSKAIAGDLRRSWRFSDRHQDTWTVNTAQDGNTICKAIEHAGRF